MDIQEGVGIKGAHVKKDKMANKTLKFKVKSATPSLLSPEQLSSFARQLVDFEQILSESPPATSDTIRVCGLGALDTGKSRLMFTGTEDDLSLDDDDAKAHPLRLIRSKPEG